MSVSHSALPGLCVALAGAHSAAHPGSLCEYTAHACLVQNVRMRTVLATGYSSPGAPLMASGAKRDIPGNSLGQGSTSTSTLTHVWGAYGAPTLCSCRRRPSELAVDAVWDHHEHFSRGFEWRAHSPTTHLSAPTAKDRVVNAHGPAKRRLSTCAHSNSNNPHQ